MNKEFVTYEEALNMKAKGFNQPCLGYFFRGTLHYNAAPYVYDGTDHFDKLGFTAVTQVGGKYDDCCLAPLKQQAHIFNGTVTVEPTHEKIITCKKGESITLKIE